MFNLRWIWIWMRIYPKELNSYSELQFSCSLSLPTHSSVTSSNGITQSFVYSVYKENLITQILPGKNNYLIVKYQWILIWVRCRSCRVFVKRMMRSFISIGSTQGRHSSWSLMKWIDFRSDWAVEEVSVPEEDRSENGTSERQKKEEF